MPAIGENIHSTSLLKLTVKLLVLILVCLGICSLLPSTKVFADNANNFRCPNGTGVSGMGDASNNLNWGVPYEENGGHGGNMAGLLIQAYDGGNNNQLIDTHYHLNSGISPSDPDWITLDNGSRVNGNARIFQDDNGNLSNRTTSYQSNTNDSLSNPNGSTNCTGWDAFGPHGDSTMIGNGHVLDCDEGGPASEFWFTDLGNPTGEPAADKQGYWEVQAYDPSTNVTVDIPHYTEGSMHFDTNVNNPKTAFKVTNGTNAYVYLIWHPTYNSTPSYPEGNGTCQNYTVTEHAGSSLTRTYVTINGVSVGRMVYTDNSGTAHYYPGPTAQDKYNPRQQDVSAWVGPGDSGGDTNLTVSKQWFYQPDANSITVSYYSQTWIPKSGTVAAHWSDPFDQGGGTYQCFQASVGCSMTIDGDGPPYNGTNVVVTPGNIYVSGTYTNTGQLPVFNPALADQGGNIYPTGYGEVDPGQSVPFNIQLGAPGSVQQFNFTLTPVYFGSPPGSIGNTCSESVPVYQHFTVTPNIPTFAPGTNPENPYEADGTTHGFTYTVGGYLSEGATTSATTTGWLTDQPAGSPSANTVDSHVTGDSYGVVSHTYNYGTSGVQPGDQYCPHVSIYPATGYHGPSGDLPGYDAGTGDVAGSCVTIDNEPYFKAKGSGGISANTGVYTPTNVCPAQVNGSGQPLNSGLLAGWNDNLLPAGTERGSGSELSALALIQITGVASAQTDITRSPTDLTFANNGNPAGSISSSVDSPLLGGNLGGGGGCTNVPTIAATQTLAKGSVGAPTALPTGGGTYQTAGNLYLGGGTVSGTTPTAIHVNGNVYLSAPITYGSNPSWTDTNGSYSGPSFTIVATGNIYISNNVTELDGIYYAQPTTASAGGTIYDCATNLAALSPSYDFYHNCNNQLLVYGSFVADNVKFLRTFGSLRDEEPTTGVSDVDLTQNGSGYTSCVDTEADAPGVACSNDGSSVFNWEDYNATYKFTSPARSNYKLKINYDNYTNPSAPNWPPNPATGYNYVITVKVTSGLRRLRVAQTYTQNVAPVAGSGSFVVNLGSIPANPTITIEGYNNYWIPYGGNPTAYDPNFEINSLELKAAGTPITPPSNPTCSGYPGLRSGTSPTSTCAAELFMYSPERYLQLPATEQSNGGATQYDAVTSLPPVL